MNPGIGENKQRYNLLKVRRYGKTTFLIATATAASAYAAPALFLSVVPSFLAGLPITEFVPEPKYSPI